MKAEKIIKKLLDGKNVSEIAREEKISRHSVSLVKQTIELIEKKYKKELEQVKNELQKCKLKKKEEEEKSLLKCIYEYKYEFLYTLIAYSVILLVIIAVAKKFLGG